MRHIARFILSLEPFFIVCALYFFWFASNFPAPSATNTGIVTEEWSWLVTALLPIWLAYWLGRTSFWRELTSHVRWGLMVFGGMIYLTLYANLPFLPVPNYAIDRADWFWLMAVFPCFIGLRWLVEGRKWHFSAVDAFAIGIIALCILNIAIAPTMTGYRIRGEGWSGLGMILRPLLGILLMGYLIESAQRHGTIERILQWMLALSAFVMLIGLTATQWTVKSALFIDIIRTLDVLPNTSPFFKRSSINPNEIGGALAWIVPFCAVLTVHQWRNDKWLWRGIAGALFALGLGAVILGQSRSAMIGIIVALGLGGLIVIPTWRWRLVAWAIGIIAVFQLGILFNAFSDTEDIGIAERDERSTSQRLAIWQSGWQIIADYPLTGVGLNNFRLNAVLQAYPIAGYPQLKPPHVHNEVLQIGTDMGILGMGLFIGLHGALIGYLWIAYRRGGRIVAVAVGMSILAHSIYGITDAIPIWDRFYFVHWLMIGVGMAQYHLRDKQL